MDSSRNPPNKCAALQICCLRSRNRISFWDESSKPRATFSRVVNKNFRGSQASSAEAPRDEAVHHDSAAVVAKVVNHREKNMIENWIVIRKFVSLVGLTLLAGGAAMADTNYSLRSPDNRIDVAIHVAKKITYDVSLNGRLLMKDSTFGMNIEGKALGENHQVKATKKDSVDKALEPVVRQKSAKIREHYNELKLEIDGGYAVVFRAYPDGVAY